jgi:aldehyde oxidoreductase
MSENNIEIQFRLNGKDVFIQTDPEITLLKCLREQLSMTGTKNGCSAGHCGTCTVIMDGKATRACLVKMKRVDGKAIETIEGLSQDGILHPLQYTFIEHGGVQCGFCTPGMIMSSKAILDQNPHPTGEEIKAALTKNRNICRCTGYVNIIKAIQAASEMIRENKSTPELSGNRESFNYTNLTQDAIKLVTGQMVFGDDKKLEGMLYGKLLWSDHPHAEIIEIDTSEAEKVPGVAAVVTARDIPGKNIIGFTYRDQPALPDRKVRHYGDSLASVFAKTPEIAAEAVKKISVKYRPLAGIFTPEDAANPEMPKLYDDGNLCSSHSIERGDLEGAFQNCAVIIEQTYSTPHIEHGFMEPESGIAYPTEDGGITLEIGSQNVFGDRDQLVDVLGLPTEKVRVIQMRTGGGFGGKQDLIIHQHLALGAMVSQRPVKIVLTRPESLRAHPKRHPAWMVYKAGADKDGHILALEAKITTDTGAYTSSGISVAYTMLSFATGAYYIPNIKIDVANWYTNNGWSGAMRGFGTNQVAFAMELHIDQLARALNMDPFEFRMLNALDVGLPTATDHILEEGVISFKETLAAAREALNGIQLPTGDNHKKIGVGVGTMVKSVGYGRDVPEDAGVILDMNLSGQVTLRVSQHDMGQGSSTGLVQIAAWELGIPVSQIDIVGPDTGQTPPTGSTNAQRQTFISGNAALLACRDLKEELFNRAAEILNLSPDTLYLRENVIANHATTETVPLSQLGDHFTIQRTYTPPRTAPIQEWVPSKFGAPDFESVPTNYCYSYNTQVAIVEVDTDTGKVQVLKVVSAQDVGKVLNPQVIEGQIHGGVMMGLGYALSEEFVIQDGINLTDSLRKCKIPMADQAPEIIPVILEIPHPTGPLGAKGMAEGTVMATTPAIINAIYDAVGVRITSLPATPEKILAELDGDANNDAK